MYVYRTFDIFDMANKLLECNLMYLFKYFFISFNTSDMGLIYFLKVACSMNLQHTLDFARSCFFCIPVFAGKVSLIFLIIDLQSDL